MSEIGPSWGPLASWLLNAEQTAEVAEPFCTACGVECANHEELAAHTAAHEQPGLPAVCSICGLRFEDWKTRNAHERTFHEFDRYCADREKNRIVCISLTQLSKAENVGFLFGALQSTAEPYSEARNAHERDEHGVDRPPKSRRGKPAVKIPKELHSELLSVGVNFELIQQRAVALPPNSSARLLETKEVFEQRRNAMSSDRMAAMKCTIVWYWDRFAALSPSIFFIDQPEEAVFHWMSDANCKLLLLLTPTMRWRREPEGVGKYVFLRLELVGDCRTPFSHLLGFCKPNGVRLAEQFAARLSRYLSFCELLETVENIAAASGESAMIVVRSKEHAAIRHLESENFVVLS
ncbi:hypothetical protein M3Y99_00529700 [Aphelenchoides fujianensis]|nr:hypothetical protein M3Y99_00529700 [Aphelenchoides fujianensis]